MKVIFIIKKMEVIFFILRIILIFFPKKKKLWERLLIFLNK